MQQSAEFEFQWYRDTKGYRIDDTPISREEWAHRWQQRTALARWRVPDLILTRMNLPGGDYSFPLHNLGLRPHRIIRLGGDLVPYRPLEIIDDIFRAYINIPFNYGWLPSAAPEKWDALQNNFEETTKGILDFIDRYGPLHLEGLDENLGDRVEDVANELSWMNSYVSARVDNSATEIRRLLGEGEIDVTGIIPKLSYDPGTRTPKLRFHVPSLRTAIWWHLMRSFDSGATLRRCEWEECRIVFEAGAGTGRRADSKFCCDQHRIAYHSIHRALRPPVESPRRRGRPRRTLA